MKNRKQQYKKSKAGFTLIEIILVVVIIGILATIGLQNLSGKSELAKNTQAKANISMLSNALDMYEITNGNYPSNLDGLLDESKGGPFTAKKTIPKDPWGKEFTYVAPGANNNHRFDLSCTSPKGVSINNWE